MQTLRQAPLRDHSPAREADRAGEGDHQAAQRERDQTLEQVARDQPVVVQVKVHDFVSVAVVSAVSVVHVGHHYADLRGHKDRRSGLGQPAHKHQRLDEVFRVATAVSTAQGVESSASESSRGIVQVVALARREAARTAVAREYRVRRSGQL